MVTIVNTISTLSRQSLGSSNPRVVPSQLASLFLVSQAPIPLPSSSPGEPLATNTHTFQSTKRKGGRHRKQNPNKKATAFGYHASHHPLSASANHVGGKLPIFSHRDGEKLVNGYLAGT